MIKKLEDVNRGERIRFVDGRIGVSCGQTLESIPPYVGIVFEGGYYDDLPGDTVVEILEQGTTNTNNGKQFNIGYQEAEEINQGNFGDGQFNNPQRRIQAANNTGIINTGTMGNVNTGSGQQFNIGSQKAKRINQGNF
jgi:hypothetical protein